MNELNLEGLMNELTDDIDVDTAEELIQRKRDLEAEIAQLNAAIEQQREAWLHELIECTAESVDAQGHDKEEFLAKLAKALGVKLGTNRAAPKTRKAHVFPDGRTYRGGKPPTWLLEKIRSAGLDPAEKGVVRGYCVDHAEQRHI